MRRKLELNELDEAISECERLLQSGYRRQGNWSLGQICRHMRLSIESNMEGYPAWMTVLGFPLRPILRWAFLGRILGHDSPVGLKTAGMYVPPEGLDDSAEVSEFKKTVERFCSFKSSLHAHPGFGKMSHEEFNRFHAAHAAHHLSFLDS